ncbi:MULTISPECIES: chitin-binding protein [Vibrio]|uniref:chitin-binding protein n=1 Tax=Vibrio TaxID=662 RepID=UPI002075813C|nr:MULTISPECIES: chitin-binding protein [Vibrio]USD31529.1 chitin-binding protein [Vibrio sp. SCSIO 43186]USD44573.1 chitin-binding protein [Vibrio sp. SCSIO 43145]USD68652.1 chitin-binding protein [Vibrio sp. SCSIO 43139]USD96342.1 chitin-binding protein [Vibrio coralliilyticus]
MKLNKLALGMAFLTGSAWGATDTTHCNPLTSDSCGLPWPSNQAFTKKDSQSDTGLRLNIKNAIFSNNFIHELPKSFTPEDIINGKNGFSVAAPVLFEFHQPFDPSSLPSDGGDSVQVFDYSLDERVPVAPLSSKPAEVKADSSHIMSVYPRARFNYGNTHIAVVTNALKSDKGHDFRPSNGVTQALSQDGSELSNFYEPYIQYLESKGITREEIVSLTVFTTVTKEEATKQFAPLKEKVLKATPKVEFDWDNSGYVHDSNEVVYSLKGRMQAMDFRDKQTGRITNKPSNVWLDFTILFPKESLSHSTPVVIYAHGLNGDQSDAKSVAAPALEDGHAVIAIDWVWHGSRAEDDSDHVGSIMKPDNAASLPGGAVQSNLDMHTLLNAINTSLQELDFLPSPDGVPDLDKSKITFLGTSLGTILGHGFLSTTAGQGLNGGFLQVPGTNFGRILTNSVTYTSDSVSWQGIVPKSATGSEASLFWSIMQTEFEIGEGVSYLDEKVTPIGMLYGLKDSFVPPYTGEAIAELANLPLLEEVLEPRDFLETAPDYRSGNGALQLNGDHLVFITKPEATETYKHWLLSVTNTNPLPRYDYVFPKSLESYQAGTQVLQEKNGNIYQCLDGQASGYCKQWSESSNQYEPGVGLYWEMAWKLVP